MLENNLLVLQYKCMLQVEIVDRFFHTCYNSLDQTCQAVRKVVGLSALDYPEKIFLYILERAFCLFWLVGSESHLDNNDSISVTGNGVAVV